MNTFINYNGMLMPKEKFSLPDNQTGLLETMLWEEGHIALWPYHSRRWRAACKRLGWHSSKLSDDILLHAVSETVSSHRISTTARIRMRIFPVGEDLHFTIEAFPFQVTEQVFRIGWTQQRVNTTAVFSGLKAFPRSHYDHAFAEAQSNNWDDGLLLNEVGRVAESAIANIFYLKKNILYTPPLTEGCLDGVYRSYFMEKHEVVEKAVTPEELLAADAVFLTNALRGKITVAAIGDVHFPV